MEINLVELLSQSGDDVDVRSNALQRLLRRESLNEEEKGLVRALIPTLALGHLRELLQRHGDLGCPAAIVDRFVAAVPSDHGKQLIAFELGDLGGLWRVLDADAYADFVEKARPLLSLQIYAVLLQHVQGCAFFEAVRTSGAEPNHELYWLVPEPPAGCIFDVRHDDRTCRARLKARIATADRDELLQLTSVLARAECHDLAGAAQKRALDCFDFPALFRESSDARAARLAHHHWLLVRAWVMAPAPDRADRLAWLADHVAELERSELFFGFGSPSLEEWVPAELRDEIGRILIDRGQAPYWAGHILIERLASRSLEAWTAALAWVGQWAHGNFRFGSWYRQRKAIVIEALLPESAPDDFDEALLRCAREVSAFEKEQIRHWREGFSRDRPAKSFPASPEELKREMRFDPAWRDVTANYEPLVTIPVLVERLLTMDLTPARAARIARLVKDHPALMTHPRLGEIVAACGPIDADALPALEVIDLDHPDQVALYRLGGPAADAQLRERVRSQICKTEATDERRDWPLSCRGWWRWLADVADDGLREDLRAWVAEAPLSEVLRSHNSMSWFVDEPFVLAAAARHRDAGYRWDRLDIPPMLRSFVEERVRSPEIDGRELVHLLGWLEGQEMPRAERLAIVIARLKRCPPSQEIANLARLLPTRTAWENEGPDFLRAIVRWDDWRSLTSVWYTLALMAPEPIANKTHGAVLTAVHLAFATVLLELASQAADAHDDERLLALLAAVLLLDPPPPIVPALRKLARHPGLPGRAKERIDLGTKLFKSSAGRKATFDGLMEAADTMAQFKGRSSPREQTL